MELYAPITNYVATLVHPSVQQDPRATATHCAYIAPRLFGGVAVLAALPAYLLLRGVPTGVELIAIAWLAGSMLPAYFLSRSGRYELAHFLSTLTLTVTATAIGAATGGIASAAASWLVLAPIEASLSSSRRVIAASTAAAVAAAVILAMVGTSVSPVAGGIQALPSLIAAALYAVMLALQTAFVLRARAPKDRDRDEVLSQNVADVITRHAADGTVLFASPAARMLVGTEAADLHGNGLFDRIHVADRAAYLRTLGEAAASGKACTVEFRVRQEHADHDGEAASRFAWIEMRCLAARPQAAGLVAAHSREIVAASRNITEQKHREEALCDARDAAESANAAKARSLAVMSHELRTPLNAIIGFSEMLQNESALMIDAQRRGEYARLIGESGRHLLSVVNAILDASRLETGNFEITPEPFAPAPVVTDCCDLLVLRARDAGVQLENLTPAGLPEMVADQRAVRQILFNLLANAITFTASGGRVTVRAHPEAASIAFVVADNGAGIEAGDLARIGEPYFQIRAPYRQGQGGIGLGLSIVRGLVRLHGGDLAIRSKIGEGTSVTVRLPLDCERAKSVRRPVAAKISAVMRQASGVVARPAAKTRRLEPPVKKSA